MWIRKLNILYSDAPMKRKISGCSCVPEKGLKTWFHQIQKGQYWDGIYNNTDTEICKILMGWSMAFFLVGKILRGKKCFGNAAFYVIQ